MANLEFHIDTRSNIALLSIGSEARIGGGEKYEIYVSNTCHNDVTAREQNKNQGSVVKAYSCKLWDSGTTESLQSFFFDTQSNKAGTGSVQCQKKPNPSECQQFMTRVMHKQLPDNTCVINVPSSMCDDHNPKPTPAPAPPAPEPKKCNPNQNPTYTPECPSGFTCKAILGSGKKNDGQCIKDTKPAPAPAPPAPKRCHMDHNPTYTPECPSGYSCKARIGKKNAGQCIKDTKPAPAPAPPAPAKQVFTCDPKNPVNPDFDCTQKLGPGSECKSKISLDTGGKWVYQCTELADGLRD